jgi:thiamine biosynthesis lipoprotein
MRYARLKYLAGLSAVVMLAACSDSERLPEYELSGRTMGTSFSVKLVDPAESFSKGALRDQIHDTLDRVENLASTYLVHSELSAFNSNRSTEWIDVSAQFCAIIRQALDVSRATDGAFDITVGPLVNLWGFGPEGDVFEPPSQADINDALLRVGFTRLHADCSIPAVRKDSADLYVDLSGWAKGFAVDELAALLDAHALENYLVEIGGELRARGHNASGLDWSIAIERPQEFERVPQTVLRVTDRSIATSGDYRNFFAHEGRRYSHTIDARTGRPVAHALAAVTVVHESAAYADAMATALLVLGPDAGPALAEELGIAAYFLLRGEDGIEALSSSLFVTLGTP